MKTQDALKKHLRRFRRRLLAVGWTAGLFWGLVVAAAVLAAGVWLDLLWDLPPQARIAALAVAAGAGMVLVGALALLTARGGRLAMIARRVDRAAGSGGQVLSGLDLDELARRRQAGPVRPVSAGLAQMAVAKAAAMAGGLSGRRAVPARALGRSLAAVLLTAAVLGLLVVCFPGMARTQWQRFTHPYGDVPPFSPIRFTVEPDEAEVIYGSALDVYATVHGAEPDRVDLVLEAADGTAEALPMFPERDGRWRAALARVVAPAEYHVRSYRARSEKHHLRVITVPRIENVRVRVTPPQYTERPVYEGPLPAEGVAGLPGTRVEVWAASNRPLSGGWLTISGPAEPVELELKPTGLGGQEARGQFEVAADGKFELGLIDADGRRSQQVFTGGITLLADQRPFIRILQPRARSLATPEVTLPVIVAAEDDYGVARLELYRSLNDSRPLPATVPVGSRPARRLQQQVELPLAGYGLEPGDMVKLFARVEDNDPAGGKGAESSVVSVEIISQAEFERLLKVREGIEVLMSKYREARRRLESLAGEMDGLRKKLAEQPPDSPVAQDTRRELQRLVRRMREESEALRKLAQRKLDLDIDENLTPQLETLGRLPDEAADALEKLLEQEDLHGEALARQLEKLAKQLDQQRQQFDAAAMLPLEQLAAVFPLLADQSRFVILAMRQRDLAERLAALKGRDGEDDPALKARMRDLEEEQRQIREDLGALLDDIEDHVARLPEEPEYDKLRETAGKFVEDVRQSGAAEAMADAEAGLAEFSGTRGHQKATEAADILEKFIKQCEGMGSCAGGCLVFQPSLGNCLGNTAAQLMAQMGLSGGFGGGFGGGVGAGGGYSAWRGGSGSVGLYGSLPGMGESPGGGPEGSGPAVDLPEGQYTHGGANPDQPTLVDAPAVGGAGGLGQAGVPLRYRRLVGQYFQRIAEEVDNR